MTLVKINVAAIKMDYIMIRTGGDLNSAYISQPDFKLIYYVIIYNAHS